MSSQRERWITIKNPENIKLTKTLYIYFYKLNSFNNMYV